jgi:hypothetical protein
MIHKGFAAVDLNEQEHQLRKNSKRSVHLYTASYGAELQAEQHGGITLKGY